ncbi:MAG TPA: class I SAM-dependent methyltransferase [Acidimicrobiia bacterium]|nr:class I SAM-dependent methyltransferase [Acidimicrobiia bacterium]
MSRHERRNREFWDADADAYQALHAPDFARAPRAWGVWRIPEADLGTLGDVCGRDVLEYGCGAAHWSIALARAGARPVGLDQSRVQLGHARRVQEAAGVAFPLVCASGEAVPLRDASFDVVFCDHGAMSFCDPDRSVPEVARLLRPGGRLVFSHLTPLLYLTWDRSGERQTRRLHEPYFGMRELAFGDGTVDFQLPYGEWIRLFRRHRLVVEDLIELRPPKGATTTFDETVPREWARRWPAEQIWKLTKSP